MIRPPGEPTWALVLEEAPDAMFLTDAEYRVTWANRAGRELALEREGGLIGALLSEVFVAPHGAEAKRLDLASLARGEARSGLFTLMERGEGGAPRETAVEVSARALPGGGLVATVRAASAAKGARAEPEGPFRAITEGSPDGICAHRDGIVRYANQALARMLGYDNPSEIVGRRLLELVHPDERAQVVARVRALNGGDPTVPFTEERLLRKDGTAVVASIGGLSIDFEGEPMVVAIARDMTDRRRQLTQMAQTERMASLGALAAGVAHEINNPLTYVILRLDIISSIAARAGRLVASLYSSQDEPADRPSTPRDDRETVELAGLVSDLSSHVSTAKEGAHRVRTIVQNLRVFARGDSDALMPVDVHGPLELAVGIAHHELKQRATVVREYAADAFVMATEGKLAQVFLQLLLNAAHAIPPGAPESHRVTIRTKKTETSVTLEIEDTGAGIPAEHVPRVFEPFFTTKPPNVGSGLGLSLCHGIVTLLGGTIAVESRGLAPSLSGGPGALPAPSLSGGPGALPEVNGGGTRFTVTLPLASPLIARGGDEGESESFNASPDLY